jgi:UDP-glucuronate decarboxylase
LTVVFRRERLTAADVVRSDLESILDGAAAEFERMSGKNLLVTGGAGFLGYYVVQSLVAWNEREAHRERIRVTVVDSYARGVPEWLARYSPPDGMRLVEHDVRDPLPPDLGDFDFVVHAAGIASPTYYRKHPIETMDANVTGLRLLLDRALEGDKRGATAQGFLFFSSSEIYGDPPPEQIPTPETYRGNVSCTGPRACYDESKRYGETLCVNFARHHGLSVSVVRPFNNYGPGLKITDRRAISDLARDVFAGRDITLLSDGSATRTFCYAADAVIGYFRALVRGRPGEAYNIGAPEPEISIREVAERIAAHARELFDYQGEVVHRTSSESDYLVDNPTRRCPDIAKARDELGYRPAVLLDEGLERTLLWYDENRAGTEA